MIQAEGWTACCKYPVITDSKTHHYYKLIFLKAITHTISKLAVFVLYALFLLERSPTTSLFEWLEASVFLIK